MRLWLLPGVITVMGLMSVASLKSVAPSLATEQTIFLILGLIAFTVVSRFNYKQLLTLSWPMYIGLCCLLILSMIAGLLTGKIGRWIPIFGLFNLQPSQLAVPIVSLVLAKISQKFSFNAWTDLAKILTIIGIPGLLILIEPNLGTTLVYLVSVGMIVFMSDISWKKIGLFAGSAILVGIFAWFFVLRDYQKQRITSFMNKQENLTNASYNAHQSLIAAGSGRLLGRGLGQGVQSHLRFLPARETDFIFASIAEEFGFVGSMFVLCLYCLLISYVLLVARNTRQHSEAIFCYAITAMTIMQTGVNIGMNIGLMPITGITLPFISYGGSSILSLCMMFGVVQLIARDLPTKPALHLK